MAALEIIGEPLKNLGNFGAEHIKAAIGIPKVQGAPQTGGGMPILPTLPTMPALQHVLAAYGVGAVPAIPALPAVMPTLPATAAPPPQLLDAGPSYADEFAMEDTSVACWPCTQRHLNTVVVTAEGASDAMTADQRRETAATIIGEIDVWRRYDVTPAKLARTDAGKRRAVEASIPGLMAARSQIQPPAADLHLAWAAAGEAERFLRRPDPSPLERREAQERMADVQGWIGLADTVPLPGEAVPHLSDLRSARQRLNREGNTHEAVSACRDALRAAAVALTPDPGLPALRKAADHARTARKAFYGEALSAMRDQKAPSPVGRGWMVDRDALVPSGMRPQESSLPASHTTRPPQDGLLGATPATAAAWTNLLDFARAVGITVRERQLPAGVDGIVKGAYSPEDNTLLLGPAATAEDSDGLQTLIHELSHALLHNPQCLPSPTPSADYQSEYADTVEEREADAATLLAMSRLKLRIEHDDGTGAAAPPFILADAVTQARLDSPTYLRSSWAAEVLAAAARQGAAVAGQTKNCPVRR